jgi:hypothetical protein
MIGISNEREVKKMVTVRKSTYVPKNDAEMKIFSVYMDLEGNTRRCEAILHSITDPWARQGMMMLLQDFSDDRAKLKKVLEEIAKQNNRMVI